MKGAKILNKYINTYSKFLKYYIKRKKKHSRIHLI